MFYESTKRGTEESSRHHPQKWRVSDFSRRIIPELEEYFLYDVDKEEENEFSATVDLEAVNVPIKSIR